MEFLGRERIDNDLLYPTEKCTSDIFRVKEWDKNRQAPIVRMGNARVMAGYEVNIETDRRTID